MIVAVHQPQYLPWLGYFEKVAHADVFVFLDTVQFKKNEFQNRNRIKTPRGAQWLTVPVRYRFPQRIFEVEVNNDTNWARRHRQALAANYAKTSGLGACREALEPIWNAAWEGIAPLNRRTVEALMATLGITTPVRSADEWTLSDDPTGRLVDICRVLSADTYLAGSGGRDYMDLAQFEAAGIDVIFQRYEHPEYAQRHGDFLPYMSVVDLICNCGNESKDILLGGGAY